MTDNSILGNTSIFRDSVASILKSLDFSTPEALTEIIESLQKQNLQPALIVVQKLRVLTQLHMNLQNYCNRIGIDLNADEPGANELRSLVQSAYIDLEDAIIALRNSIENPNPQEQYQDFD